MEQAQDLVALAAVSIGFVLFFAALVQAWDGYEERQALLRSFREGLTLADTLRRDPALAVAGRPDLLDAAKLQDLALNFWVNVTTDSGSWGARGPPPAHTLVAPVPVAVALGPARVESGTLRVALGR